MKRATPIIIMLLLISTGIVWYLFSGTKVNNIKTVLKSGTGPSLKNQAADPESKVVFKNYGSAPDFPKNQTWLNSSPLTLTDLQGKVVLINFWSYSCIACIRTLPTLQKWQDTYNNQGLQVIGVHTPQYVFEKVTDNVQTAVTQSGLTYPIMLDNTYILWDNFHNRFWPTQYLIDKAGRIAYQNVGEGHEERTENAIKQLLSLDDSPLPSTSDNASPGLKIGVSDKKILFGLSEKGSFANTESPTNTEQIYTLPKTIGLNQYAIEGTWKLDNNKITLTSGYGRLRLNLSAANIELAADSIKPVTLQIKVDGKLQPPVTVQLAQQYKIYTDNKSSRHSVEISIPQAGLEAFNLTFN